MFEKLLLICGIESGEEMENIDYKSNDDGKIVISISGRVDSNNSEEYTAKLQEMIGDNYDKKLVFDLENLQYISSAGLRMFLKNAKKSEKKISLINVSREVYDVFEVTGMVRIFDVYKIFEQFDVSGYEKLGEGVSGAVYKINDELIVKMYNPYVTLEMAEKERSASKESFLRGVPTAIPFEIVKNDDCYGVKYELMNGKTLGQAFNSMPDRFDELVTKYVNVIKNIKEVEVEEGVFPTVKNIVNDYLDNVEPYLSSDDFSMLKDLIKCLPNQNRFVHGDMHPGNIMLQNDELLIIDMADVATGWEFYDLTQVYNDIDYSLHLPGFTATVEATMGMKQELLEKVWELFISKYYETDDENIIASKIEEIKLASSPIIVSRIGALPDSFREGLAGLMKQKLIDPVIRPNVDRIKEIYAKNLK